VKAFFQPKYIVESTMNGADQYVGIDKAAIDESSKKVTFKTACLPIVDKGLKPAAFVVTYTENAKGHKTGHGSLYNTH
jgi:hypothetical protein